MIRTIDEWKDIFKDYDCNQAAKHVLGDLTHYFNGRPHEKEDIIQLANALIAFREEG